MLPRPVRLVTTDDSRTPASENEAAERELCAAVRGDDSVAFEVLFRRYYDPLCAFAERYLDPFQAEEAVSAVFLRIWERRHQWQVRGSVRAYLYSAVRNRALQQLDHERIVRRVEQQARHLAVIPALGSPPPHPDASAAAREFEAAVEAAIDALPARARETFMLRRRDGLSYDEIAEILQVTRKTVENQIARAMRILRLRLEAWLT